MKRRHFTGLLIAAPAVVRAESLMRIYVPRPLVLFADGIHDDADALIGWFKGDRVVYPDGRPVPPCLEGARLLVGSTVLIADNDVPRELNSGSIVRTPQFAARGGDLFKWENLVSREEWVHKGSEARPTNRPT